jgi:glycosyltransferase involved in cell wall biosynthesis
MIRKVAIVHNAYGKPSGEEVAIDNLATLLEARGMIVRRFSRSSKEIDKTKLGKIPAFFSGIHNPFSRKAFRRFLEVSKPDVVHIHNLYPLISPSILPECTAQRIPVVMTVHNFRLACPNALLLSHGEICRRCLGGREYWCILRNCENDIFKSAGYALRTAAARMLRRYYDNVDHFICLSEFQKNILVGEGLPADRVSVLANPISFDTKIPPDSLYKKGGLPCDVKSPSCPFGDNRGMDPRQGHSGMTDKWIPASAGMTKAGFEESGGYVAYVGRITPEKDIITLIEAARRLGDVPFKFAGSYHRMPEVLQQKPDNCEFLGELTSEEIMQLYGNARIVAFATRCYEGFPMVLLEAMSHGLPVICSRIGGLPEIVTDGVTGLLYEPENIAELTERIRMLWQNPALCRQFGDAGRRKVKEDYAADRLMDSLIAIYEKVIREGSRRRWKK